MVEPKELSSIWLDRFTDPDQFLLAIEDEDVTEVHVQFLEFLPTNREDHLNEAANREEPLVFLRAFHFTCEHFIIRTKDNFHLLAFDRGEGRNLVDFGLILIAKIIPIAVACPRDHSRRCRVGIEGCFIFEWREAFRRRKGSNIFEAWLLVRI